jgi:hypothetical protein
MRNLFRKAVNPGTETKAKPFEIEPKCRYFIRRIETMLVCQKELKTINRLILTLAFGIEQTYDLFDGVQLRESLNEQLDSLATRLGNVDLCIQNFQAELKDKNFTPDDYTKMLEYIASSHFSPAFQDRMADLLAWLEERAQ